MGAFSPSPFDGDDDSQGAPWQRHASSLGTHGTARGYGDQKERNRDAPFASSYGSQVAPQAPSSGPVPYAPNRPGHDERGIAYARPDAGPGEHEAVSQEGIERPGSGPSAYFAEIQRHPAGSANGTNVLAIASMLSAIFGFGPVAVIFGHVALSQIKRTGEGGRTFVTIGLTLGYLGIFAWIALVMLFISNDIDLSPFFSSAA
ncbi:DUF4190 domain-containing protein [Actinomycetaceae bacterium L2_0104]